MSSLPQGALGKLLAIVICLFPIAVLYLAVIAPVSAFYDSNAQLLEQRVDVIRRSENEAEDLPRLRAAAARRRGQSERVDPRLSGASDAVAAATLQSSLKDLAEQEGAKLASVQMLAAAAQGGFRRVGVRVSFSGDLAQLTALLRGVETAERQLFVGDFEVHGMSASSEAEDDDTLSIVMDVYGFRGQ
jgi:general secretion pathway protein M